MGKKTTSSEDELRSQHRLRTIRIAARGTGQPAPSANDGQEDETPLGEVRLRVKLTNAVDEAMVRRGLLTANKVRHYEADALVDSGALRSVLPSHVVQRLGLAIVRTARVTYANDGAEDVDITEVVGIDINGRRTTEETLVLGFRSAHRTNCS